MTDAVATMLSFPPDNVDTISPRDYEKAMDSYIKKLEKLQGSAWTKAVGEQNVLELIDPEVNSLPYLNSLLQQVRAAAKDRKKQEELLDNAIIFCTSFDPVQVRYLGEQWRDLMEWVTDMLANLSMPDFSAVTTAMLRLDPTAGTFTTLHLHLVRRCLEIGAPSQALPILDKNLYAFPVAPPKNAPEDLLSEPHELSNAFITTKSGFTHKLHSESVLEYYLLGAHVYIGLRNLDRARLFLEYIILHPSSSHATSALQVEAFKKWVLIGLLSEGKRWPLPRTHDVAVMKSIRSLTKPYDALAENFEKRDHRKMAAEMDVGAQIWQEDGNQRLVKEVGNALLRYRVLDMQKTYAALPVSRVATFLDVAPDVTTTMLGEMIRSGHLNASVTNGNTPGDAVLRFHPATTTSSSDSELEHQTQRIQDLIMFVRDADRRLQLTKEYVETQRRAKRAGADGDLADQMDLTWDAPAPGLANDGDEDIMAA
ncbi:hypothetical protein KC340_g7114 [Hortaea werneckii]|nr:hypothetical protein KC342_g6819 [Hortaea werneckii]KAI7099269.1 hypothetical protein KC339_g8344 [Hortaea werneckii]KAI7211841.1 hypothetical protein KC365_g14826 [Hortaea werneckii]KAI7322118.1 hypothetical protein KC340_g7114 [Hortaea werneckii]KAI7400422.1 hypothetical protein KC328_g3609 [Hortaea werneckii]